MIKLIKKFIALIGFLLAIIREVWRLGWKIGWGVAARVIASIKYPGLTFRQKPVRRSLWLLINAGNAALLFYFVIVPLQGQMGLNFISTLEPYFQFIYYYRIIQLFMVFGAKYLFIPFHFLLGYFISSFVLIKIGTIIWKPADSDELKQSGEKGRLRRVFDSADQKFAALNELVIKITLAIKNIFPGIIRRFLLRITRPFYRFGRNFSLVYLTFCTLFTFAESVAFLSLVKNVIVHYDGAMAMRENCTKCHGLNRPNNFNHTASIWEITVDRMYRHAPDMNQEIPDEVRRPIIDFLVSVRSYSDERLMKSKCYTCHPSSVVKKHERTAAEWAELIDRMHRENTFYITVRQRDQLVKYITSQEDLVKEGFDPVWDYDKKIVFEKKCSTCHTLDIIYMPHINEKNWPKILRRMGRKEPSFLNEKEALSLKTVIDKATSDIEYFRSNFPHSTMREDPNETGVRPILATKNGDSRVPEDEKSGY